MKRPAVKDAYDLLKKLEIEYTRYEHEPISSVKHYEAELPGPQVKNLLLKTKKNKQYFMLLLPEEKKVDLKRLAAELGTSRLSFASPEELEALLGLHPGEVTPIALPKDQDGKIQVVIDESVDREDTIGFHPNVNTQTVIVQFRDLERILESIEHPPVYKKC